MRVRPHAGPVTAHLGIPLQRRVTSDARLRKIAVAAARMQALPQCMHSCQVDIPVLNGDPGRGEILADAHEDRHSVSARR